MLLTGDRATEDKQRPRHHPTLSWLVCWFGIQCKWVRCTRQNPRFTMSSREPTDKTGVSSLSGVSGEPLKTRASLRGGPITRRCSYVIQIHGFIRRGGQSFPQSPLRSSLSVSFSPPIDDGEQSATIQVWCREEGPRPPNERPRLSYPLRSGGLYTEIARLERGV